MKISYEMIHGIYDIPVKRFEPEKKTRGYVIGAHGFGGDKESSAIEALAEKITERGLAVLAFDFPAHGESSADNYFCLLNCRLDLAAVRDFADELYPDSERRGIFATSFGGYVTLLSLDSLPPDMKTVLRAPAVDMRSTFESLLPVTPEQYRKTGFAEMGFERRVNVPYGFLGELRENDISQKDMQREMLIIHGSRDDIVLPEHIQRFCEANPRAKLKVIDGADHRFKGEGELEAAIAAAADYIMS